MLDNCEHVVDTSARLVGGLLAEDLRATGVVVTLDMPRRSPTEARAAYAKAVEHRALLTERDRMLLRALEPWIVWQPPNVDERQRRFEELVRRYPADAELGFYLAGVSGSNWLNEEHLAPLVKAVEIDPKFANAWWQLGQQRAYLGDMKPAREALGQHLFRLMSEGPADDLLLTENAQPAIMANAIATLRVAEKEGGIRLADKADYVAGHSLVLANRAAVEHIADAVLERKELFGDELLELLNAQKITIPTIDLNDEASWPAPFFAVSSSQRPALPAGESPTP